MGQVRVHGADLADGRVQRLRVKMQNLPARTIDRDTAVSWMRDGHSLLPMLNDDFAPALQLVEIADGEERRFFIRDDHQAEPADTMPEGLPGVDEVAV